MDIEVVSSLSKGPAVGIAASLASVPARIADISLNNLAWPIGRPERLSTGTVRDMTSDDHIVLMPRKWFWYRSLAKISAKVSLAIPEPKAFHGQHYFLASLFHRRFHRILTADPK